MSPERTNSPKDLPLATGSDASDDVSAMLPLRVLVTAFRAHWKLVALIWLVCVGAFLWSALMSDPTYEASATVQIDPFGGARDYQAGTYMWWDTSTSASNEVRVMASWPVVLRAARDPASGVTASIVERHAYRPLDVLARRWRGPWQACDLVVYGAPLDEGTATFEISVDPTAGILTIRDGTGSQRHVEGFQFSESFEDRNGNRMRDGAEPFEDGNGNGTYDQGETFVDLDRDGIWDAAEVWRDLNGNGHWDPEEPYSDANHDGAYSDGESYLDINGDGKWTRGEPLVDTNNSGDWDPAEPLDDRNGNGRHDPAERFTDVDGNGRWDDAEPFEDRNGDGSYQQGTELVLGTTRARIAVLRGEPAGKTFSLTLRSAEAAAAWIQSHASAAPIEKFSSVVGLKFRAGDPGTAASVANALVRAYLEFKRELKSAEYQNKAAWLSRAVSELRVELTQLERERDEFIRRKRAVLLGERAQALLAEQGELLREQLALEEDMENLRWRASSLAGAKTPEEILVRLGSDAVDPRTRAIAERLTQIESSRRAQLLIQGAREDSPHILKLDSEIEALRADLQARVEMLRTGVQAGLAKQAEALRTRMTQVREESKRQQQMLLELPDKQRGVAARSRVIDQKVDAYQDLVRSLREAELASASLLPAVTALNPARRPANRVSPSLVRAALSGLALGLLLGLVAAFLAESLRSTLRRPDELEVGLGLRVLGAIPAYDSLPRRVRRLIPHGGLVARDVQHSAITEAYRAVSASIRFGDHGRDVQLVAVTSALAGEGKTITLSNLAVVVARGGSRVVLIDADLRRSRVHQHFDLERAPGLADVIEGNADLASCLRSTDVEGLRVLPAGTEADNPGALLESAAFNELIQGLRSEADIVLIDCPPILGVADPAPFLRRLDGVILLVRSGQTSLAAARAARDQVLAVGGKPLGSVLNGFDLRRVGRRAEEYHGYYAYYE